jgi:hypothetical protein
MGQKITLQNTGTNIGSVSYQNLSDLTLVSQMVILPNQTKTIWCVTNSLNIARIPNSNVIIVSSEDFPPSDNGTTANPQKKTEMVIGTIDSSPNWQSYVFNYDTGQFSSPVDTGVNYTNYGFECCPSIAGLSQSGYMVLFSGLGNVYVRFYDYLGNEIGTYSNESDNYQYYFINNKFLIINDYINGKLVYSDGESVKTIEWDTNNDLYVDTDYDDSISNKFLVYSGNNFYSSYQLLDMDGVTPLMNYDNRFYDVTMPMYDASNFIPAFIYNTSGTYSFFNIYDSNGKILQEVDLTNFGDDYTNYDINYFGNNKMSVIFYNNGDGDVPYQIYVYDGDNNLLTQTSHDRGFNYLNWDTYYDYSYCGINTQYSQDFHIVFMDGSYSNDYDFRVVDFCDIVSYFNVNQEFSTYTFATDANYSYYIAVDDLNVNQTFQALVSEDSGNLSLLTITSTGSSVNDVCSFSSLSNYYFSNISYNGDTYVFTARVPGGDIAYAYDMEGNQLDARPLVGEYSNTTAFNTIYIKDISNGWYFNNMTNNFVPVGYYTTTYYPNYSTDTILDSKNGYPLLLKNGLSVKVIYNDSVSSTFTLPENNDYSIDMTNNSFMYTYENLSNVIVSEIYDLSFNIITSQTTSETSWNDTQLYGDRGLLISNISGGYKVYGLSANGNGSIEILNNNYGYSPNDNLWWCGCC